MPKIKTSELTGAALDWAVAKCEGRGIEFDDPRDPWLTRDGIADQPLHSYTPSTDWSQGGPIIEREGIQINFMRYDQPPYWTAHTEDLRNKMRVGAWAPTPLIAAMRCFVASRLGDEVDVPDELA